MFDLSDISSNTQQVGAPSPQGTFAPTGGVTIKDNTYSAGNPWASDAATWQQGLHAARYAKGVAADNTAIAEANKPDSLPTQVKNTVTGLPGGIASILGGFATNPLGSAQAVVGGLMDVGPAAVNTMSSIGDSILSHIYGPLIGGGKIQGIDLPLAGQTMNEYIGNNSDASQALGQASKMFSSYEIGGGVTKGMGLGATVTDAAGNTIARGTLISRMAGNVVGGQVITDPNASAGDRLKQAAFDAAFAVGDETVRAVLGKVGSISAASAKATKMAAEATTNAKNTVMNDAIRTFGTSGSDSYNPGVVKRLNNFLNSEAFDNSKNMVEFEENLQKALGSSYDDPAVQAAIKPIVDNGHQQIASAFDQIHAKPKTQVGGTVTTKDILSDPEAAATKVENKPTKPGEVKYVPKEDLGKDEFGHKRLAQTQVDTHTGNAVVYYDKSLDTNLTAKKIVLDHEQGHIMDKQLNGGNNISAELGNYKGNKANLDKALGDFARKNSLTVPEAAANLKADIAALADAKNGPMNEQFAEAVSKYRQDPKAAFEAAPTFAKLMEYVPQDGKYSEHSTSIEKLQNDSPIAAKMVNDALAKSATEQKIRVQNEKIAGTGLETGKNVKDALSFNPEKVNAPQDVVKLFNKMEGETASHTEGRMSKSNADIQDLARLVGLTPDDLVAARPGSIANAETLTAARQLVLNKAQALADRLKGIDVSSASDAQLKALKDDYARLVAMQQSVAGLRTEAANTLRSLSIEVAPGEDFTLKDTFQKLQQMGIASKWDAELFSSKVGEDVQLTTGQKIAQGAMKTWYASILSGPATPLRHGVSVMSNLGTDILSKLGNPALWKEVVPSMRALFNSLGPAFEDAKNAFNHSGAEAKAFDDLNSTRPPVFTGKWATYGKTVEFVGRYMDAAATGYTRMAREVEDASLKVYSPSMSNELQKALASSYAESINYLGEPKGYIAKKTLAGAKALTSGETNPLRVLIPFQRVVVNVLDRQFDYIPGTSFIRATDMALKDQVDAIMKKFDLSSPEDRAAINQRLRAQQLGRAAVGIAVSTVAFTAAKAGFISGAGPTDYAQKLELERTGWRPDSIKIGDIWLPYDYLGPLGGVLSMAGNMHDAVAYDKDANNDNDLSAMLSKGMVGWMQSQLDRSFLKGVSDLMQAITDKTKQSNYLKNLEVELLPIPKAVTGSRAIVSAALGNEYQYQTHTALDKIRAELGLSGSILGMPALEPQTNAFGEPLKADMIFGITPTISKADMVDTYLQANDVVITIPSRNTQYTDPNTGKKRTMTDQEYGAYLKASGTQIYQNLETMIPDLNGEDVDSQRSEVRAMLDSVRAETRDQIMSGN